MPSSSPTSSGPTICPIPWAAVSNPMKRDSDAAALPLHLIMPEGRFSAARVRAFVNFAVPRLKSDFARMGQQ